MNMLNVARQEEEATSWNFYDGKRESLFKI